MSDNPYNYTNNIYIPSEQTTTTGGWQPPSTAPEPGKVFGTQALYCYRCKARHDFPYRPGVRTTCPVCGAALIPWELDALADVLHNQDMLLEEGKRFSKLYEDTKKDLAAVEGTSGGKYKKLYDSEKTQRAEAESRRDYWIEQDQRHSQELANLRDTYYHPDTHSFCQADQTASAGVIGRVRTGWSGMVYKIHDLGDIRRLCEHAVANATPAPTRADSTSKVGRLERRVAELEEENSRLRRAASEQPTKSRRSLE